MDISNINSNKIETERINKRFIKKSLFEKLIKLANGFIEKYLNFTVQQISIERDNQIENYKAQSKKTFKL